MNRQLEPVDVSRLSDVPHREALIANAIANASSRHRREGFPRFIMPDPIAPGMQYAGMRWSDKPFEVAAFSRGCAKTYPGVGGIRRRFGSSSSEAVMTVPSQPFRFEYAIS